MIVIIFLAEQKEMTIYIIKYEEIYNFNFKMINIIIFLSIIII